MIMIKNSKMREIVYKFRHSEPDAILLIMLDQASTQASMSNSSEQSAIYIDLTLQLNPRFGLIIDGDAGYQFEPALSNTIYQDLLSWKRMRNNQLLDDEKASIDGLDTLAQMVITRVNKGLCEITEAILKGQEQQNKANKELCELTDAILKGQEQQNKANKEQCELTNAILKGNKDLLETMLRMQEQMKTTNTCMKQMLKAQNVMQEEMMQARKQQKRLNQFMVDDLTKFQRAIVRDRYQLVQRIQISIEKQIRNCKIPLSILKNQQTQTQIENQEQFRNQKIRKIRQIGAKKYRSEIQKPQSEMRKKLFLIQQFQGEEGQSVEEVQREMSNHHLPLKKQPGRVRPKRVLYSIGQSQSEAEKEELL